MKVPAQLALPNFVFWNQATLSLSHLGPFPFIWRQMFFSIPEPLGVDLSGQTVLITGGNSGIGYEAAKKFLNQGAKVVLGVRTAEKGKQTKEELAQEYPVANIEVISGLDMADFEAVKAFAKTLCLAQRRLDIVVLNAGLYLLDFEKSVHGYEIQLQVNVLSTSLLALLLLPKLMETTQLFRSGSPARLMFIGSEVHAWASFKKTSVESIFAEETAHAEACFCPSQAYHLSKLLQLLFERELAIRVDTSKVVICSCSPGYCTTGLFKTWSGPITWICESLVARTAEVGARCYVNAALHTPDTLFHGRFFSCGKPMENENSVIAEPLVRRKTLKSTCPIPLLMPHRFDFAVKSISDEDNGEHW